MSVRAEQRGQPELFAHGDVAAPKPPLVGTAMVGSSADQFPGILQLYVPPGAVIADVTWGKGVFWDRVPGGLYTVLGTDLKTGTDLRRLPYPEQHLDAHVMDPPFIAAPERGETFLSGMNECYSLHAGEAGKRSSSEIEVLGLYYAGSTEAWRCLKPGGVSIVKIQDEIRSHKQFCNHLEFILWAREQGWVLEDVFVLVNPNTPPLPRGQTQQHARKNHSYFLVFRKPRSRK